MNDCTPHMGAGGRPRWGRWAGVAGGLVLVLALSVTGCSTIGGLGAPVVSGDRRSGESARPPGAGDYVVVKGDTMYSIAWRNGLDYRKVAALNNIAPPYTIFPGQTISLGRPVPPAQESVVPRAEARPAVAARPSIVSAITPAPPPADRPTVAQPAPAPAITGGGRQPAPANAPRKGPWQWPTEGKVIQGFARSDPQRKGIRISGRMAQPVWAAANGDVVYSGDGLKGYGQLVILKHANGYLSAYGFNRGLLVKEGDRVSGGMQIAQMGEDDAGKPILHFEIRRDDGQPVDPEGLLPRR